MADFIAGILLGALFFGAFMTAWGNQRRWDEVCPLRFELAATAADTLAIIADEPECITRLTPPQTPGAQP